MKNVGKLIIAAVGFISFIASNAMEQTSEGMKLEQKGFKMFVSMSKEVAEELFNKFPEPQEDLTATVTWNKPRSVPSIEDSLAYIKQRGEPYKITPDLFYSIYNLGEKIKNTKFYKNAPGIIEQLKKESEMDEESTTTTN